MKSVHDLREMDTEELGKELEAHRSEQLELRFQHAMGALENHARLGQVKRQIARILTVLADRKSTPAEATTVKAGS